VKLIYFASSNYSIISDDEGTTNPFLTSQRQVNESSQMHHTKQRMGRKESQRMITSTETMELWRLKKTKRRRWVALPWLPTASSVASNSPRTGRNSVAGAALQVEHKHQYLLFTDSSSDKLL
tara:strand:- start:38 stop:403 length:366 start_codon:yes stop_codon:yes gene_type:complete